MSNIQWNFLIYMEILHIYPYIQILSILFMYTHTQHLPNLAAASLLEFNCKTFSKVLELHYKSYERTYFKRTWIVIRNSFQGKK